MQLLQLYGYAAGPHWAETPDSTFTWASFPASARLGGRRAERQFMKKVSNSRKATMDSIYFVSAADVADKIIDRMRCGWDPLLFADSSLALFSLAPALRTRSRPKSD
jgi:hypothetical protein